MNSKAEIPHTKFSGNTWNSQTLAVSLKNVCKSYKIGEKVLQNFNMAVASGTIYSLLGASGCGKTTALSLIVGILHPTSGTVEVFRNSPGSPDCGVPGPLVGYMPQGISLYEDFTILEILLYYGRIYGLSEETILNKIKYLSNLLDLPGHNSRISNLSGGQQRRVSLAACLIHEPKLLILDEPTVGVDPLLREKIWEYLHRYVSEEMNTVIITTHYIEETKNSHTIGVMRNGQMLIEESPKDLMERHESPYLEEVITRLFKQDATIALTEILLAPKIFNLEIQTTLYRKIDPEASNNFQMLRSNFQKYNRHYRNTKCGKYKALYIRNILNSLRNPVHLLLFLFLPAFQSISIYPILGAPPKGLPMGIVNPESNFSSTNCVGQFQRCSLFSCAFVNSISKSVVTPIFMQSEDEALDSIRQGETWGYMKFPENYTMNLITKYSYGNFADNDSLENSEISFRMDLSHVIISHLLAEVIFNGGKEVAIRSLELCGLPEKQSAVELPLNFRKPFYGEGPNSNSYVSATTVILITCALPLLSPALVLIIDRKQGTMFRNVVAGVSHMDNLITLSTTELVKILLQIAISYSVSLHLDWDIQGSHLLVIALLILTGIYGLSLSFHLALICEEQIEAILCTLGFVMFHLPLIGVMWPIEGIPSKLRPFANCIPLNWVSDAMRSIMIRGWPLYHPKVYPAFIILIAMIILQSLIAVRLWRKA